MNAVRHRIYLEGYFTFFLSNIRAGTRQISAVQDEAVITVQVIVFLKPGCYYSLTSSM